MKNNKNKRWLLGFIAALVFGLSLSSITNVYAEDSEDNGNDENYMQMIGEDFDDEYLKAALFVARFIFDVDIEYDPESFMSLPNDNQDTEETGGIELEINRYGVERYMVNNEDTSGLINGNLNTISNAIMSINHLVVEITDSTFEYLFSVDLLNEIADDLQSVTNNIYDTLKDYFAEIFVVFLMGYLMYLFVAKGSLQAVLKKSLIFVCVVIVAGFWIANSSFLLKTLNSWAEEGQGFLVEAGNGMLDFLDEKEGVYADIDNIDEDATLAGTIAVMRNVYFDLALKRPYLMINYDETNETIINENDVIGQEFGFGFDGYNRVDRLLAHDLSAEAMGYRTFYAKAENYQEGNQNMGAGGAWKQFGLVFVTLITTFFISIPFAVLGALNFLLQLLLLAIAFVIPFAAIISYIPQMAQTLFKTFGKLAGVLVLKVLLGIFILFLYLIAFLANQMIPPDSIGMYYLNVIVLAGLMFFLMIKRNAVISFMTAGYVASMDKNIMSNIHQGMGKMKKDVQGAGKDIKSRFMPSSKPNKPTKSSQSNKAKNDDNKAAKENSKTNSKSGQEKDVNRTPQLPKTDKENSRVVKNKKQTPIERTKQLFSRNKKSQQNDKQQQQNLSSGKDKESISKNSKKGQPNNKPIVLNKDYKAKKNSQPLKLGGTQKKSKKDNLSFSNFEYGGTERKLKTTRNKQDLNLDDKKQDINEREGVNKNKKINYENRLYNQYNVERNKEIESVEDKKKDRNIDKGLS
ncbi:CD3337/EF1877 family mobilome membrane protein [Oceanobacillus sp. FSL K6-0251]|uniref:CD3337/EF1877 family mobilome membrane protein n=1 Tax=Oceanobacillus sp. FSL K6-0251 TaxID=2921602 RepID=UPI0030F85497